MYSGFLLSLFIIFVWKISSINYFDNLSLDLDTWTIDLQNPTLVVICKVNSCVLKPQTWFFQILWNSCLKNIKTAKKEYKNCEFYRLSIFESQSSPSKIPSPLIAEVLKIAQSRFLISSNLNFSAIEASSKAPGKSCHITLSLFLTLLREYLFIGKD